MNSHSQRAPGGSAAPVRESMIWFSPALVLLTIAVLDSSRYADPDLYGHLRFGQQILLTGHAPRVDPYSYSITGLAWVSHEWLSDVIIAWLYSHGGAAGLKLLKLGCSAGLVVTLLFAMEETGASALAQFAILFVAAVRLSAQMQFRPQIFTYLLLSVTLLMLARDTFRGHAPLWTLPPIFALWANLHGGFVVGLGAMGLYALVSGARAISTHNGAARLVRLCAITAACAMATLLNPYGTAIWFNVLHTVGNPAMLEAISEWQPLYRATITQYHVAHIPFFYDLSLFGIFIGLGVALAAAPSSADLALSAIAVVLIAAAIAQVRNVPLGMIAAIPPLAYHATLWFEAHQGGRARFAPPRRQSRAGQAAVTVVAFALAAETGLFSPRLVPSETYPAGALAFMRSRDLYGNILCKYSWNDYLIFHEAPKDRVFIDSRFEMVYPSRIINAFFKFSRAARDAGHTLADFPNDYVLIEPNTSSERVMAGASGWKLIYSDGNSMLYAPRGSRAAAIAGIPVRGSATIPVFP